MLLFSSLSLDSGPPSPLIHSLTLKELIEPHFQGSVKGVQSPGEAVVGCVEWHGDGIALPLLRPQPCRPLEPAHSAQLKTCFQLPMKSELEETY